MRSLCFLLLLLAPSPLSSQDFLIQHVRVFDGEHTTTNRSVLVRGGKILSIDFRSRSPKSIRILNGQGQTLLPGLIDAHTHIRSAQDLKQSLVFGVTTDLAMLMDQGLATHLKTEEAAGLASDRADLFSSGYCATAPGGHGTEYGLHFPTLTRPDEA